MRYVSAGPYDRQVNRNVRHTNLFTIKYYPIFKAKSITKTNEKGRISRLFNNKRQP